MICLLNRLFSIEINEAVRALLRVCTSKDVTEETYGGAYLPPENW